MNQFDKPITELAELALQKPEDFGYWGSEDMFVTWGFSGIDETAMSKILEVSNFQYISSDLMNRYPDDFRIEEYRHWACGWVKRLTCRILNSPGKITDSNITDAFLSAIRWHKDLDEYPIANEDHYGEMQAAAIFESITEMPNYLSDMIDKDDAFWVDKILHCLDEELNVYIDPDAELYPKDSEILMAAYICQLWNEENIDLWEDFCSENNLQFPPKKKNPNQLNLFEEQ